MSEHVKINKNTRLAIESFIKIKELNYDVHILEDEFNHYLRKLPDEDYLYLLGVLDDVRKKHYKRIRKFESDKWKRIAKYKIT